MPIIRGSKHPQYGIKVNLDKKQNYNLRVNISKKNNIKLELEKKSSSVPINYEMNERNIDYTEFKENYILIYDEINDKYKFVDPDFILQNSGNNPPLPETFKQVYFDKINDYIGFDAGEY